MSHIKLKDKLIVSLDSIRGDLVNINESLGDQSIKIKQLMIQQQKSTHQLRINNMYKAHENDMVIDDNIFENDELD